MLIGVAEVLSGLKKDTKGTVKSIFQPAEKAPQEKMMGLNE